MGRGWRAVERRVWAQAQALTGWPRFVHLLSPLIFGLLVCAWVTAAGAGRCRKEDKRRGDARSGGRSESRCTQAHAAKARPGPGPMTASAGQFGVRPDQNQNQNRHQSRRQAIRSCKWEGRVTRIGTRQRRARRAERKAKPDLPITCRLSLVATSFLVASLL